MNLAKQPISPSGAAAYKTSSGLKSRSTSYLSIFITHLAGRKLRLWKKRSKNTQRSSRSEKHPKTSTQQSREARKNNLPDLFDLINSLLINSLLPWYLLGRMFVYQKGSYGRLPWLNSNQRVVPLNPQCSACRMAHIRQAALIVISETSEHPNRSAGERATSRRFLERAA